MNSSAEPISAASDGLDGWDVRHLAAVLAVAEERSFSRAAARLGYTQSAVSQQIGALERRLGVTVFDRAAGPRRVELTQAGQVLVRHARAVVSELRMAGENVKAVRDGKLGTVRVGTVQSVGTKVLPQVIERFHAAHPRVDIQLTESCEYSLLADAVRRGELDVSFVASSGDASLEVIPLFADPYVFMCAASSPFAGRDQVGLTEVAELPLVGFRNVDCQNDLLRVVPRARFVFQSDDNGTVQGCIAAGVGFGLVPLLTVDAAHPGTVVIPVAPPAPVRELAVVVDPKRTRSRAIEDFIALAQNVARGLGTQQRCSDVPR